MALTDAVKDDIRRHLGFPLTGLPSVSPVGGVLAIGNETYRFNQVWGQLEWRMQTLTPAQEAKLTGFAYGAIAATGLPPNPGDSIELTITGGGLVTPVVLTIPVITGMTQLSLLASIVSAANTNAALRAAGFMAVAPWGSGPYSNQTIDFPQMAFTNPQVFSLALAITGTTGLVVPPAENGVLLDPKIQTSDNPVTWTYGFVPICNYLHGAIGGATRNQDTNQADVWKARVNEVGDRQALYSAWTNDLAQFMGIPKWGPAGTSGPRRRGM